MHLNWEKKFINIKLTTIKTDVWKIFEDQFKDDFLYPPVYTVLSSLTFILRGRNSAGWPLAAVCPPAACCLRHARHTVPRAASDSGRVAEWWCVILYWVHVRLRTAGLHPRPLSSNALILVHLRDDAIITTLISLCGGEKEGCNFKSCHWFPGLHYTIVDVIMTPYTTILFTSA